MSVSTLSDGELEVKIKSLAQRERELTVEVLHHLREVELRRLHLRRGFGSLFEYCTQELKYSEGSAGRRIAAMRMLKDVPEVIEKIEAGSLTLSNLASVANLLRREERDEGRLSSTAEKLVLLSQVENKSKRVREDTSRTVARPCDSLRT